MAYGFRIATDSGIIQIDDTFQNLAFISKGTLTLDQEASVTVSQGIRYKGLTLTGRDTPILALRADAPVGFKKVQNQGSGQWYYEICCDGIYGPANVVTWYLFDRPPASGSGFGIRIKDSSNREVFNSNNRYFRPKAFNSQPPTQPPNRGTTVDVGGLPAGTYAYVPAACRNAGFAANYTDTDKSFWQMTDAAQNLATGVRWGWAPMSENPSYPGSGGWYTADGTGYMTVIDVAGY